jgi:YebC/PmpR family DNA-binding regulatory protein
MAGHSKWKNIRYRKRAQDAVRGRLFTRLGREITVAAREGGVDLNTNAKLRLAVERARQHNMTKDAIERAIQRGTQDQGEALERMRYEGYGPSGVAIMVDCLSDNKNRTVAEVRHAFSKHDGQLAQTGSVSFLFRYLGYLTYETACLEDERFMDLAILHEAEDVLADESRHALVVVNEAHFMALKEALLTAGYESIEARLAWHADRDVLLSSESALAVEGLLDALESLDDVQEVVSNLVVQDE